MPTAQASDADRALALRLARGERGAAERLLAEHVDQVYEFVHYRVGGDVHAAEDVVQETFLAAFEGIAGFDGRSSLRTWLCGIAKNRIRMARRKRAPRSLDEVLLEADPEIDRILSEIDREPLPDAVIERRETRELVGATLSSLPEDYRRVLVAKYVDGLSVADIAGRTRRGAKATESLLTRARAAFARVFELLARERGGLA